MLNKLRGLAAVPYERGTRAPLAGAAAETTLVAESAYTLGLIDGAAKLARELLADLARGECTPGSIDASEFLRAAAGAGEFRGE